jgi:N-acetylmuramoyl-L-alanine amidase
MVRGRVIIDPGHGGKDPGTHAASGMIEKNLVLAVGRAAAERLRARGVDVHMTRSDDRFIELDDRAYSATQYRANVFVSIHADWNPSSGKRGHTVLLPQSYSPAASALGYAVSRSLVAAGWPSYGVRHDTRGLAVLRKTACPAVLVELGFLSNSADAAQLSSPAVQERLGQAIADGIADYLRGR